MEIQKLQPRLDSAQSFYGKAQVMSNDVVHLLKSYDTIVAKFYYRERFLEISGLYSATTSRHIKEFIYQYVGRDMPKGEIDDIINFGGAYVN